MWRRNLFLWLVSALLWAGPSLWAASPQRVDFEDLRPGRTFAAGDRFVDSAVEILVEPTIRNDGSPAPRGRGEVVARSNRSGGSGNEIFLDPFNLRFRFPVNLRGMTLLFSEWGVGNVNLEINGDLRKAQHLTDLNGAMLGGVRVHALGGAKDQKGVLELVGEIRSFMIGGYELFIDDVTPWVKGEPLYFADCGRRPGAVLEYRSDTMSKTVLFDRTAGDLHSFVFAPWDPHRLFFVNANDKKIFEVELDTPAQTEKVVFTHSTYVRDLAFDNAGVLYFSESSGAGGDGKIYRVEASGAASLFFTVGLGQVDGFWAGNFDFAPDGTLLVSSGNISPAAIYEADLTSGTPAKIFESPSEAVTGFSNSDAGFIYSNNARRIYSLKFTAGGAAKDLIYEDASAGRLCEVGFRELGPGPAPMAGDWVMPYGIRGFRWDQIKPTGLIDYTDASSGLSMVNAPFGGGLAFHLNSAGTFPTPDVYYYRFSYRRAGAATWTDFSAPVSVHYVKNRPGLTPIFPTLALGPKEVNGLNLYRFRPHESELPMLLSAAPGEVEWPKNPFPGDVYRGYLDTVGLTAGPYEIRFEVYNQLGVKSLPGPGTFSMIVPNGVDASGALLTTAATLAAGGVEFPIHVDNRSTMASLPAPAIGTSTADACGFLRYSPDSPGEVRIGWSAWHEGGFAMYRLNIVKGGSGIGSLPLPAVPGNPTPAMALPLLEEVGAATHHADGAGGFHEMSPTDRLLAGCDEAAFAVNLHVYAKATNGNGYRIAQYDSQAVRAFAVAPYWP